MLKTLLHRRLKSFTLLLFGSVLLSCGGEPSAAPDVIAQSTYGDTAAADLETFILSLPAARRQPAEDQNLEEWKRELLEEMLISRRLGEEAEEANLLASDEGLALLASVREPLFAARVEALRIAATVNVTEDQLREFHQANPGEFSHGPQIRVRHIFKRTTRDASAEEREAARAAIDAIHSQLEGGASFIDLARTQSDSETAALDGLIGRLDPGALGPAVDKIVWSLAEDEISEVVSTPVGFHIFRVDKRIEPFHMELEEARTRLRRRLEREATEASLASYFEELLEASGALLADDDLENVDADPDSVVFALDDFELTHGEFLDRLFSLPFSDQRAESMSGLLRQIATQQLYQWEAARLGLADEPAITAQLAEVEDGTAVELAFRNRRRSHLEALDDALLEGYYEENEERFRTPQLLRVSLLVRLFEDEGQGWFEVYEELDRLARAVRAGEADFAEEASERSQDPSAARRGDSGWIRPGAIGDWAGPRAGKAVLALVAGEVSDPILVESYNDNQLVYGRRGYMLVRAEEIRSSGGRPFEEVRDLVAEHFVVNGSEDLQRQIGQEVLEEIDAAIFQDRL